MHKQKAIELLGGSVAIAAEAMGVSYQAVSGWPDELPPRISDRVLGVVAKRRFPELVAAITGGAAEPAPTGIAAQAEGQGA
jgi:hypothetical protein